MASAQLNVGCVVQAGVSYAGKQGLDYTPGISAETVGAHALWLGSVVLPPGGRTKGHLHEHHESAFFIMSGEVELWTGDPLARRGAAGAGDFLYIPANVPHIAVNRGTLPAVCVGARTDAHDQESVVMRPELDSQVP